MQLIDEIERMLHALANGLMSKGRGCATNALYGGFEELALQYANASGYAFGTHTAAHPASCYPSAIKTLYVCRDRVQEAVFKGFTEGSFLFDQCWLIYYNSNASRLTVPDCEETLEGYMVDCELVMESELDLDGEGGSNKSNAFHRDFQKLIVARAPVKSFVFRSLSGRDRDDTFKRLSAQLICSALSGEKETYLVSCWCDNAFVHRRLTP